MNTFWSAHTHSKYSAKDAMPAVSDIVNRAAELEYPALGLTDHGNMAGTVQLYTGCKKAGIEPLPGVEAYISFDRSVKKPDTFHMCLLSTTEKGYRNLAGLVTQSHKQFKYKPLLDFADLASAAEDGRLDGIVAFTGCWFGMLPELLKKPSPTVDVRVSNILSSLAGWFGSGLYVEIQNHAIYQKDQDSDLHANHLYNIAQAQGLPIVLTQDSHYIYAEEQETHNVMKKLVSWSDDPDNAIFPGDGYHMVDSEWMKEHHIPEIYNAGMEGLADLASKAKVRIPELDTFSLKVPDTTITGNPDKELEDKAGSLLESKFESGELSASKRALYDARIAEELDVVISSGFSGYLLFSQVVCKYMDKNDINYNVRGSASGSLLCWLLGITSFDPIAWGLRFDRFLSKDRTKPPDIDIDVEHDRRVEVVDWLRDNFHVVNISTWLQMGLAKETSSFTEENEQKGSLMVSWKMWARKTGEDPNRQLNSHEWAQLRSVADKRAFSGYGVHAAGLLVAPDAQTAEVVPLSYVASSKTLVTSFDKDDVEKLGLVKLDLLGLKTLTALRTMKELTGVSIEDIPLNDKKVFQAMSKGQTAGMFQLEGGSAMNGVRRLKPTKINDVIAAMALFRPATMESGATDDFISRRQKTAGVPQRHSIISEETKDTYGVLLYQEQVIGVMRNVGLDSEEIEKVRKVIKASNASVGNAREELQSLMERVRNLAKEKGMNIDDLAWLEQALEAYAGYGFNKAHATAYGVLAYITGYFSVHHPVAFWTGMLNAYTGAPQEKLYVKFAREAGITLTGAHVNRSSKGYTANIDTNTIRKGLLSIKGLGTKAADELLTHAPYASLDDLARKVSARRVSGAKDLGKGHSPEACGGIVAALFDAGALSGLEREILI